MTPDDTSEIIAAIDRNTKELKGVGYSILGAATIIWVPLVLIMGMLGCPRAKATPLLPPLAQPIIEIGTPPMPPPNPHVRYWHTQYVPGPDGVLPVEVFAPRLVAQLASDAVDVPEPAMFALMLTGLMAMSIYLVVDSFFEGRRLKRLDARLSECELRTEMYQGALEQILISSRDEDSRTVARKALEEPK